MPDQHPLPAAIRKGLHIARDPERAPQMQAYMKSEMPYLGVKAAIVKQVERTAWKDFPIKEIDDYEWVVRHLWENARYREERYAAQDIAWRFKKYIVMEMLPLYQEMIITGAWWDHVDFIAADLIGELLRKYPDQMKPILKKWIRNDDLWIRRSAILSQLRFKEETDTEMLFAFCEAQLKDSTFWIRKAIGWALRQHSKTDPESVRQFIDRHGENMAGLTLREASKYI